VQTLHLIAANSLKDMDDKDRARVLILYGSQTGNAQVGRAGLCK
jgi:hypothetical protein